MLRIENAQVFNLEGAVIACRNAFRTELVEQTQDEFGKSLTRAKTLVVASNNSDIKSHSHFRVGVVVSFDIVYPQYWSMEFQRYHFAEIVSSTSKMHMLTKMDLESCCNEYVSPLIKTHLRTLIDRYNAEPTKENFMKVISNVPMGLELGMQVVTNYEQLATIYKQRRHHRLEDWQVFCDWIETLPMFDELIK